MATTGTTTVNFGSAPGTNVVITTITGQTGITTANYVEAFMMGADTTATHNAIEHQLVPMRLSCTNIVNGTGFDIIASSDFRLTGTFSVRWVWA